jgi:hypothetical protein
MGGFMKKTKSEKSRDTVPLKLLSNENWLVENGVIKH